MKIDLEKVAEIAKLRHEAHTLGMESLIYSEDANFGKWEEKMEEIQILMSNLKNRRIAQKIEKLINKVQEIETDYDFDGDDDELEEYMYTAECKADKIVSNADEIIIKFLNGIDNKMTEKQKEEYINTNNREVKVTGIARQQLKI